MVSHECNIFIFQVLTNNTSQTSEKKFDPDYGTGIQSMGMFYGKLRFATIIVVRSDTVIRSFISFGDHENVYRIIFVHHRQK